MADTTGSQQDAKRRFLAEGRYAYFDALNAVNRFQKYVYEIASRMLRENIPGICAAMRIPHDDKIAPYFHSVPGLTGSEENIAWTSLGAGIWLPGPGITMCLILHFSEEEDPSINFCHICQNLNKFNKVSDLFADNYPGFAVYRDAKDKEVSFWKRFEKEADLEEQFAAVVGATIEAWSGTAGWSS
ncbi:MAG: hypothetical protein AB1916_06865 [Thermodesulfobacteriota bacterium]